MDSVKIGVYDSGIGGLSVWKELYALMPEQDYIYVADTAHCPYGDKSIEYVKERADRVVSFLLKQGADMVVVACNTATAAAISYLRQKYDIPFVGMEPAVKPAVLLSKTRVVGVLATSNTFKGRLYRDTVMRCASDVKLVEVPGRGLVEAVENGEIPVELIKKYVNEMLGNGADTIVLGCTHFPFLQAYIAEEAGHDVQIINPAPAVAAQAMKVAGLAEDHVQGIPPSDLQNLKFYSTGNIDTLMRTAKLLEPRLTDSHFEVLRGV